MPIPPLTVRTVHSTEPTFHVGSIERFYRHGWHSWSPTGWVDPQVPILPIPDEGRRLGHDDPRHAMDTTVSSSGVGIGVDASGTATLLGALAPDGRVRPVGPELIGSSGSGEIDWLIATGTVDGVLGAYASALGEHLGRRPRRTMRVWCSWYSHYEGVTEQAILDAVDAVDGHQIDVVQIDDGWEQAIGDWVPNDDFPAGMEKLADVIRASGRTAGLWLAPFIARSDARLVEERPELLLRDAEGAPVVAGINWGGPYFSLDPTSGATQDFVHDMITKARSWGFDYLKLDFLYAAAFPGRHVEPMDPEAAYRAGVEAIREAAGDDCYLLACGAPVIASIGVFDGIRIGPDVAEFWEEPTLTAMGDFSGRGARNAIITSSERLWLRDLIDTDPDVAFFDRSSVDLDEATLGSLRDLAAITGFVGTSDRLELLTHEESDELDALLADEATVNHESLLRWRIDGRVTDFGWVRRSATSAPSGRMP